MSSCTSDGKLVVVIGRQFGSGGRKIGRMLAERIGASYYDKELLLEAAGECGITRETLAAADGRRPSPLRWFLHGAYGASDGLGGDPLAENIYAAVANVIRNVGSKGSCVIVGRTADHILRENPMMVSVFLHAPLEHRAKCLVERGEHATERQATEAARKADRQRENFYNYFTGRRWGTAANYHLCVDSSQLDDAQIVEVIASYVEIRRKNGRQRPPEKK